LRRLLKIRIKGKSKDKTQELSIFQKKLLFIPLVNFTKERTPIYSHGIWPSKESQEKKELITLIKVNYN